MTKEEAYKTIAKLVERFAENVDEYKRTGYNEQETRIHYINPFFEALGWDVGNTAGLAQAYREVIHEDKIKVGGATKAPDYCFTVYGQRKFFVDAKRPSINIKSDIHPAYQVRRYGWSAKLPIAIVTDFEEFSIYDCSKKPKQKDRAAVSRISYITYDKYLDEFDFLWDTFAKENILKGRFDKFVASDTKKKGTATVDDEFLKSIEEWRKYLATTIALRNKALTEDEINYAVQKIIDRIIFLRICEDRGVERYGELKKTVEKGDIYQNLFALYRIADDKYNSGLFDFKEDRITPGLIIDNKVLKTIIKELYYPNCEYEFSVMPADILGSVYERFLGKTIRLTKAHHAKIEEKPEVRKAGGVYYTPKYVVDYIVENTVGKLIKGKTPKQIKNIKICDPACGSGSFLIGAYQYLLNWHLKYYTDNHLKKKKDNPLTPDNNLTTAEKKRILLNNIFGVDIDAQAVEVTKLNLLLKALEGETQASISQQLSMFHERVLPNLGNNIKCGNSLICPDFYDNQLDLFSEQMKKINAFDWKEGFSEIFKQGGFDAIIGNPPYVRSQYLEDNIKIYLSQKFTSASYQPDLFAFFIEQGILLLHEQGKLGYIIPNGILTNTFYAKSRSNILNKTCINIIVDLKDKVFDGASVDTSIFILTKETKEAKRNKNPVLIGEYPSKIKLAVETPTSSILQNEFLESKDYILNTSSNKSDFQIIERIKKETERLGDLCIVKNGMKVRKDFVSLKKEDGRYKKFLLGASVKPYSIDYKNKWVCYDKSLERQFTNQAFRDEEIFLIEPKLLIRQVMGKKRIFGTIDSNQYYVDQSVYILYPKSNKTNLSYILGIVNSELLYYFFSKTFSDRKETFPKIKGVQLSEFPIKIEKENKKTFQPRITKLVNNLLKLNSQLQDTKLETQRQQIQRTINHTEKKIDELVYGLYGLSEVEINIVERTNKN